MPNEYFKTTCWTCGTAHFTELPPQTCYNCLESLQFGASKLVKDLDKELCYMLYKKALKRGILTRQPCAVCNSTKKVAGHHVNYQAPLTVVWLCSKCHVSLHKILHRKGLLENIRGLAVTHIVPELRLPRSTYGAGNPEFTEKACRDAWQRLSPEKRARIIGSIMNK